MGILTASPIAGRWTTPLVLASLLLAAMPARASADEPPPQDSSRGSILAGEREKKATEVSTPERGVVERALYWYDNQYVLSKIFGGWNGLRLAGGDFPAGAGTKIGVGFSRGASALSVTSGERANRPGFDTVAAYSTRGYSRVGGAFSLERIGGAPLDLRVRGQYYKFPQEDFFGLGADSSEDNRTNYLLESSEAGAELQWKPWKHVDLSGGMTYMRPKVGSGTDSRFQSTEQVFDPVDDPRACRAARLPAQRRGSGLRLARQPAASARRRPLRRRAVGLPRSGSERVQLPPHGDRPAAVRAGAEPLSHDRAARRGGVHRSASRATTCRSSTSRRSAARGSCAASASSASRIATAWR